jgi:ribosomal-protein-alanine N-acetyltransferase
MALPDIPAVIEIDQRSFTLPWPQGAYRYELEKNPAAYLWVAEKSAVDGQRTVIGMIAVWLIIDEAHISTLATHPDHRRQGVAKRLIITAIKRMIKEGATSITLEVRSSNLVAQALYNKFDFKIVGRRPRYYKDNREDAILMTLDKLDQKPQIGSNP